MNLAVYLIGAAGAYLGWFENPRALTDWGHYDPTHFRAWQLVTYQFLHDPGGIWHIGFNLLFLWVFGCAVEDRLGRASFLTFYLMGGVLAALAHVACDGDVAIADVPDQHVCQGTLAVEVDLRWLACEAVGA